MRRVWIGVVWVCLWTVSAEAYNYLYVHSKKGIPIGWKPGSTISYYLDPGGLGKYSNEQAHTLLKEAMKVWENASADADMPKFEFGGYLPEDVNGSNYEKYVSNGGCHTDDLTKCPTETMKELKTVIVFDDDNYILNHVFCRIDYCGAVGGARVFGGSFEDPEEIKQGIVVIGSAFADKNTNTNGTIGILVHELGHLLGLAHTIVNQSAYEIEHF